MKIEYEDEDCCKKDGSEWSEINFDKIFSFVRKISIKKISV